MTVGAVVTPPGASAATRTSVSQTATTPVGDLSTADADIVDEFGQPIVVVTPPLDDAEFDKLPEVMREVALARRGIEKALAVAEAAKAATARAEAAVIVQQTVVGTARHEVDAIGEVVRARHGSLQAEKAQRAQIAVAAYTSAGLIGVDLTNGGELKNLEGRHYSDEVMKVAASRVKAAEEALTVAEGQRTEARARFQATELRLAQLGLLVERARAGQVIAAKHIDEAQESFEDAKATALAAYESSGRALVSDLVSQGFENGALPTTVLVTVDVDCTLEPRAAASWLRLRTAAAADGVILGGGSCYRTRELQAAIFATATPGFAARPGFSMHGWGRAVDVVVGGSFLTSFGDPAYRWLAANGERFGWINPDVLGPASDTPEPWHWEWSGADPSEVEAAVTAGAAGAAPTVVVGGAATPVPAAPGATPTPTVAP